MIPLFSFGLAAQSTPTGVWWAFVLLTAMTEYLNDLDYNDGLRIYYWAILLFPYHVLRIFIVYFPAVILHSIRVYGYSVLGVITNLQHIPYGIALGYGVYLYIYSQIVVLFLSLILDNFLPPSTSLWAQRKADAMNDLERQGIKQREFTRQNEDE